MHWKSDPQIENSVFLGFLFADFGPILMTQSRTRGKTNLVPPSTTNYKEILPEKYQNLFQKVSVHGPKAERGYTASSSEVENPAMNFAG